MSNQLTSFELKVSEQVKSLGRELTEEELHGIWNQLSEHELLEILTTRLAEAVKKLKSKGENNEQ